MSVPVLPNDGSRLEDPLDFIVRPGPPVEPPMVARAHAPASADPPSAPRLPPPTAAAAVDDDEDVIPTSDPEEAAEEAALAPRRSATATQAERWARELAYWATAGRRGNGLASRFPAVFAPAGQPSSPIASTLGRISAPLAASDRLMTPARWVPPEPLETPPPLPPSTSFGASFTLRSHPAASGGSSLGGWTAAEKGKGRAQQQAASPGGAPAAARFTPSPTPSTIEMERAVSPPFSAHSRSFKSPSSAGRRSPRERPVNSFGSPLTPAPSFAPLPSAPVDRLLPSPAAAVMGEQASPANLQPSFSPRAAQELADAITRLDDPATTTKNHRSLRQRTSLQLNPYTRERAAYRHLLARGGLEAAIVQRREELGAQSGGATADDSFVPPPEKEPAAHGAKTKGKGRVLSDEDRRLLETVGGPLPADEDDELDLLASVSQMGGGELARWEEAVRRRKAEAKAKERKEAKKTKAGSKAFPMDLGQAQKENREPFKYVPPPGLLDNIDEEDSDFSAFGIHRPSARTGSPSPPRPKKRLKRPQARDSQLSASDSDSGQSIETDAGRARQPGLDKKRARILGRMMPAVAANRHIDQLRRAATDRERAAKAARQQGGAGGETTGPVRAGQSVVRRAPGAAAKPLVIEGDSESDEGDALVGNEPLERNSWGHHRHLDALLGRDSIDPAEVAAMYPDDGGLLGDTDDDSSGTIVLLDDDESEEEPAAGDIRAWLKLPPAAAKAASVVDLMLNRTRANARPGRTNGGGGGGNRAGGVRPTKSRPPARDSGPARAGPSSHAVRGNGLARPRAINRRPKQRPIALDDDSIYGDVAPRAPVARRGVPQRARTGAFLPRSVTLRRAAHPPVVLRNPPLFVPRGHADKDPANEMADPAARPMPLGEAALLAQGVAGPRLPAAQYAAPHVRPPSPPVRPQGLAQAEGVPWAAYESFSLDFDIRPLPAGLTFPPESDIRQGRLEDFLGLLRTSVDQLPLPLPVAIHVFEIQLDPAMALGEFQQVFAILADRLYDCTDAEGLSAAAAAIDIKRETTVLEDAWETTRFTCAFATARQTEAEFEEALFTPIFDTLDHLLERLEPLSTPTTATGEAKLFFHLHWFALELLVRLSLVSAALASQVKDSLLKVAEVLVRRLLEYGFNRTIKSVKTAATNVADDGCVGDYTAELWVGLIHVFGQLAAVPGALPLEATLSSLITAASESTTLPTQGLLAAERTWYLVQGLSAISQFTAAGRVYPLCSLPAQWPLVTQAVSAVKLESDPVADRLASSTALAKRDKYVWTVLGRCHLLASRWGWRFDVHDKLLGLLSQKVFKSRGFVKLHSDPTSDFPLFLRESDQALVEAIDPEGDSAFDVFLKLLHLAVRDFGRTAADGGVPAKQAERAVSRLLAISAPVGRTPFTRKTPPTLRELSTLINRYSFTMVAVFLSPSADNAAHSLRLSQSFLEFDAADFKSRKVCVRAAMYLAVLYRHFALDLGPVADWLGQMAESLLHEHALVARPAPGANLGSLPPLSEIVWALSMILGSIRHIIESRGMTGQALNAYPDPALLHKSWTVGILSSSLALEPITGAEVLQCVQAFLDARRSALTSATNSQMANIAGDSQDEFAFEFAPMDFDDPSLRQLLGEADAAAPTPTGPEPESAAAAMARKDKTFAEIIGHTVSPAIYRLLGNMLSGDWLSMIGGAAAAGSVATKDDMQAREAYVARLVDCWAGCAAVLVQHRLKDWSSYVELGAESWKRFGSLVARRQVGLRFLWNVISLDPAAFSSLREELLSIWFQAVVAPPTTWTVEPDLTAQLIELDGSQAGSLFAITPFARREPADEDATAEVDLVISATDLKVKRSVLLDEVFTSISIDMSRPAAGNVALQQRKAFLISLVRDLLLSMSDFYMALEGDEKRVYALFALDVVRRLREKSGDWLNERSVRELAYWSAVANGLRTSAAAVVSPPAGNSEVPGGVMDVDGAAPVGVSA